MAKKINRELLGIEFPPAETPQSLTVRDLLEARHLHHAALSLMPNVIGTAIGLYRLQPEDDAECGPRKEKKEPRTLYNSRVTDESDPAVLVFVRDWIMPDDLPPDPRKVIPQFLYLPDGRGISTCIIKLGLDRGVDNTASDASYIKFPENLIGGGCGVFTIVQGQRHVGTVSCLLTDGERFYALTARHVVGPEGQEIFTRIKGKSKRIGESDALQVRRKPFCEMYPEYCGEEAIATIDAGLIRLDGIDWWTSQVLGIGELDDLADLHPASITLGMIGTPLKSSGAVSGDRMKGEIVALFPRYRGIGGVDYLTDLLIGPKHKAEDEFRVAGGDSGSLWVLDAAAPKTDFGIVRSKPVAVTWGAVDVVGGGASRQLVLASFVSTICKALDLELVNRQNIGYRPVWGADNHRSFASISARLPGHFGDELGKFLLGMGAAEQEHEDALEELSVLPDNWRFRRGRKEEGPNHYADIDMMLNGTSLANIELSYESWNSFYSRYKSAEDANVKFGALPLRVGEVFDLLVQYIDARKCEWAYAAAGALIHYVADACNPAHVTIWTKGNVEWTASQKNRFHGIWDKEASIDEAKVRAALASHHVSDGIADGRAASAKALELMKSTLSRIPIQQFIVDENAQQSYANCRNFLDGPDGQREIAAVVAEGCGLLLDLWKSAWKIGHGNRITPAEITNIDVAGLHDAMLNEPDFLPSRSIQSIVDDTNPL